MTGVKKIAMGNEMKASEEGINAASEEGIQKLHIEVDAEGLVPIFS